MQKLLKCGIKKQAIIEVNSSESNTMYIPAA